MIPSLTVVSLYGPALSFCKSGKIFFALLKDTTFWGISLLFEYHLFMSDFFSMGMQPEWS